MTAPSSSASTAIRHTPLLTKLNLDWADRYRRASVDFGVLGERVAGELVAEIRAAHKAARDSGLGAEERAGHAAEEDRLLYGLLVASHGGNRHAERVLIQILLPAVERMAHRIPRLDEFDRCDRVGCAIGAAWEAIGTYRMHLRGRVHANLTLRTLHILCPEKRRNDIEVADRTSTIPSHLFDEVISREAEQPVEVKLMDLFTWAVDSRVVTREQVALLSRTALSGRPHAEIAAEMGLTVKALRNRADRIRRRISRAVDEQL